MSKYGIYISFKMTVFSINVSCFLSAKKCDPYIVLWLFDAVICAFVAVSIYMGFLGGGVWGVCNNVWFGYHF